MDERKAFGSAWPLTPYDRLKHELTSSTSSLTVILPSDASLKKSVFYDDDKDAIYYTLYVCGEPRNNSPNFPNVTVAAPYPKTTSRLGALMTALGHIEQKLSFTAAHYILVELSTIAHSVLTKMCDTLNAWAFHQFIVLRADKQRKASRDVALMNLKQLLNIVVTSSQFSIHISTARLQLFGLASMRLALAGASDVDINVDISIQPRGAKGHNQCELVCHALLHAVNKSSNISRPMLTTETRMPTIRYVDNIANTSVGVTVGNENDVASSRLIRRHLQEDVRIWETCILVIKWAKLKKVIRIDSQNTFLCAMGWTVMTIYILQHAISPAVASLFCAKKVGESTRFVRVPWASSMKTGRSRLTCAQLLMIVLRVFGSEFNFCRGAISVNLMRPTSRLELLGKMNDSPLFIENPSNFGENLAENVSKNKLKVMKQAMRESFETWAIDGDVRKLMEKGRSIETRDLNKKNKDQPDLKDKNNKNKTEKRKKANPKMTTTKRRKEEDFEGPQFKKRKFRQPLDEY